MVWSTRRPAPFAVLSTGHGTLIVSTNDYRLSGDGGYGVGYQLFQTAHFDPEEVALVLGLLEGRRKSHGDGLIALDCGANIGVHTIEWARLMHGWGDVVAIEAQERIYYALAGNIAINNCFNAKAIHAAVGAKPGSLRVPQVDFCRPSSYGSLELRPSERNEFIGQPVDYSEAGTVETKMVSIDAFGLPRVDLIKIDVEGMELEVLKGASESIERYRPQMLIEAIKCDEKALKRTVEDHGYVHMRLGVNLLALHRSDRAAREILKR